MPLDERNTGGYWGYGRSYERRALVRQFVLRTADVFPGDPREGTIRSMIRWHQERFDLSAITAGRDIDTVIQQLKGVHFTSSRYHFRDHCNETCSIRPNRIKPRPEQKLP